MYTKKCIRGRTKTSCQLFSKHEIGHQHQTLFVERKILSEIN